MTIRARLEQWERERLAPYAVQAGASRGRRYQDEEHPYRTPFQRDRDKIIHTPAFRRLEYKTQVFVTFEGGQYRTRLTHTLEAAQIARTIARALRLNEDLTEAITLAHDLGHPPFGHGGEEALDALVRQAGEPKGFEHNRHSLRLVEELEGRHPLYPGLNLTWEVREGITKHRFPVDEESRPEFEATANASLEAQVADLADGIAYSCHDVEDSLQAGLVRLEELEDVPLWAESLQGARRRYGLQSPEALHRRAVVALIDRLVSDVITASEAALASSGLASVEEVRHSPEPLIRYSSELALRAEELRRFLLERVYGHFQVVRMWVKGQRLLQELFGAYDQEPRQLPAPVQTRLKKGVSLAHAVCDHLASLTDRSAVEEHRRLFDMDARLLP